MVIHDVGGSRVVQQVRQQRLANFDRLPSQIFAVELEQVEDTMHGGRQRIVTADQVNTASPLASQTIASPSIGTTGLANRQSPPR